LHIITGDVALLGERLEASDGTGGGNESTILTFIPTLLHHSMIYVGQRRMALSRGAGLAALPCRSGFRELDAALLCSELLQK
jgi:hypothetical protein